MAFKFNIKSDEFTNYGRMFDYAKLNPRFDETVLSSVTNEQARQSYIYTYALLNNVETFSQDDFDEEYYETIRDTDPIAASNYIGYKAFGDKDEKTNKGWENAREHFVKEQQKKYMSGGEKFLDSAMYGGMKIFLGWLNIIDTGIDAIVWLSKALDPKVIPDQPKGDFFQTWRNNMGPTNAQLNEDRWFKSFFGTDKTIAETSFELQKETYYHTELYPHLEDAFDTPFRHGSDVSVGDFIDFGADLTLSVTKMSLNWIPVIGHTLYWSTVMSQAIADNREVRDPLLMVVRTLGQFGIEWISEQIFGDSIFGKGLVNPQDLLAKKTLGEVAHFFAKAGIDMGTNAIEEMLADVMNFGMDFALRAMYSKSQDVAIFDDLPSSFGEGAQRVMLSGISGALIGMLGVMGEFARTPSFSVVNSVGKTVNLNKFKSYQYSNLRQTLGDVGNSHAHRDFVAQRLAEQGLSDTEIAEHEDYKKATKDDLEAMELYNLGMQRISAMLSKYGYTEQQIDSNKKSVAEMFNYYRGLEKNFIANQKPLQSRKERKADAGKTTPRMFNYLNVTTAYEKRFSDHHGGNVNIGIVTTSYDNKALDNLAQKAGFEAIVVGKIGSNGEVEVASPMITLDGKSVKGELVGDVLYVDSDYFDQHGASHSSFIRQIVVNRLATNVVAGIAHEFNLTSGEHGDFYHILAGIFKGDVVNGAIHFRKMVEKYGMEVARQRIVEAMLNSPVALRALYINKPSTIRRVNKVVWTARNELQKNLKDDATKRVLNHYYARYLENVALGITSDISTFDKPLARNIKKILKDTPLEKRADALNDFAEKNYELIKQESKDISLSLLRALGFTQNTKIGKDMQFTVSEKVVEYLKGLGYVLSNQQAGVDYVDAGEVSPDQIAAIIFQSVDLQMLLTVSVPTFRNTFVNFLLDFMELDGISDEQLTTARDTLRQYARLAFASAPANIQDSIKQRINDLDKKLIAQGRLIVDGEVISEVESVSGFVGDETSTGAKTNNAWESWNVVTKSSENITLVQIKHGLPTLFGDMNTLEDVYNYLYGVGNGFSDFLKNVIIKNFKFQNGEFSADVSDILKAFGVAAITEQKGDVQTALWFISHLFNKGERISEQDIADNKTIKFTLRDVTKSKISKAFVKSFGYVLNKVIRENVNTKEAYVEIVSLKVSDARKFVLNKFNANMTNTSTTNASENTGVSWANPQIDVSDDKKATLIEALKDANPKDAKIILDLFNEVEVIVSDIVVNGESRWDPVIKARLELFDNFKYKDQLPIYIILNTYNQVSTLVESGEVAEAVKLLKDILKNSNSPSVGRWTHYLIRGSLGTHENNPLARNLHPVEGAYVPEYLQETDVKDMPKNPTTGNIILPTSGTTLEHFTENVELKNKNIAKPIDGSVFDFAIFELQQEIEKEVKRATSRTTSNWQSIKVMKNQIELLELLKAFNDSGVAIGSAEGSFEYTLHKTIAFVNSVWLTGGWKQLNSRSQKGLQDLMGSLTVTDNLLNKIRGTIEKHSETKKSDVKGDGNTYVRNLMKHIGIGNTTHISEFFDIDGFVATLDVSSDMQKDIIRAALNNTNIRFEPRRPRADINASYNNGLITVYANETTFRENKMFNEVMHELTHALLDAQKIGGLEHSILYSISHNSNLQEHAVFTHFNSLDDVELRKFGSLNKNALVKQLRDAGVTVSDAQAKSNDYINFVKGLAKLFVKFRENPKLNKDLQKGTIDFSDILYMTSQSELIATNTSNLDNLATILMPELSKDSSIIVEQRNLENLARKVVVSGTPSIFSINQNDNAQWSKEKDSDGERLTDQQVDYFFESKVRDGNGYLLKLYHGSRTGGIQIFDSSKTDDGTFFFTSGLDNAISYTSEDARFIYPVYVNLKNPYIIDAKGKWWNNLLLTKDNLVTFNDLMKLYEQKTLSLKDLYNVIYTFSNMRDTNKAQNYINKISIPLFGRPTFGEKMDNSDVRWKEMTGVFYKRVKEKDTNALALFNLFEGLYNEGVKIDSVNKNILGAIVKGKLMLNDSMYEERDALYGSTRDLVELVKAQGIHDGIIIENVIDYGNNFDFDDVKPNTVVVAFDSAQIKLTTNLEPTGDPNISFSRNIEGVEWSKETDNHAPTDSEFFSFSKKIDLTPERKTQINDIYKKNLEENPNTLRGVILSDGTILSNPQNLDGSYMDHAPMVENKIIPYLTPEEKAKYREGFGDSLYIVSDVDALQVTWLSEKGPSFHIVQLPPTKLNNAQHKALETWLKGRLAETTKDSHKRFYLNAFLKSGWQTATIDFRLNPYEKLPGTVIELNSVEDLRFTISQFYQMGIFLSSRGSIVHSKTIGKKKKRKPVVIQWQNKEGESKGVKVVMATRPSKDAQKEIVTNLNKVNQAQPLLNGTATSVRDALKALRHIRQAGGKLRNVKTGVTGLDFNYIQRMIEGGFKALLTEGKGLILKGKVSVKTLNENATTIESFLPKLETAVANIYKYYDKWLRVHERNIEAEKEHGVNIKIEEKTKEVARLEARIKQGKKERKGIYGKGNPAMMLRSVNHLRGLVEVDYKNLSPQMALVRQIGETLVNMMGIDLKEDYGIDYKKSEVDTYHGDVEIIKAITDIFGLDIDELTPKRFRKLVNDLIYGEYLNGESEQLASIIKANNAFKDLYKLFFGKQSTNSGLQTMLKYFMHDLYDTDSVYGNFTNAIQEQMDYINELNSLIKGVKKINDDIDTLVTSKGTNYKIAVLSTILKGIQNLVDNDLISVKPELVDTLVDRIIKKGGVMTLPNGQLSNYGVALQSFLETVTGEEIGVTPESIGDSTVSKFVKSEVKKAEKAYQKEQTQKAKELEEQKAKELERREQERLQREKDQQARVEQLDQQAKEINLENIAFDNKLGTKEKRELNDFLDSYVEKSGRSLQFLSHAIVNNILSYRGEEAVSQIIKTNAQKQIEYFNLYNKNTYDDWVTENSKWVDNLTYDQWNELVDIISVMELTDNVPHRVKLNMLNAIRYFQQNLFDDLLVKDASYIELRNKFNTLVMYWTNPSAQLLQAGGKITRQDRLSSAIDLDYIYVVKKAFTEWLMNTQGMDEKTALETINGEIFSFSLNDLYKVLVQQGDKTVARMTPDQFRKLVEVALMNDPMFGAPDKKDKDAKMPDEKTKREMVDRVLGDVDAILSGNPISDELAEELKDLSPKEAEERKREEIKLTLDGAQELWNALARMKNYEAMSYMQTIFEKYIAEKNKNIDFSRDALMGKVGDTQADRDRNKKLAWNVVTKQFRSFRFMSMLSNPTVFFKNMWLNTTNAWVQKHIVDKLGGKIGRAIEKRWRKKGKVVHPKSKVRLVDANGNYYTTETITKGEGDKAVHTTNLIKVEHRLSGAVFTPDDIKALKNEHDFDKLGLREEVAIDSYYTSLDKGKSVSDGTKKFVQDHLVDNGFLKYTVDRSPSFNIRSIDPTNFGKYLTGSQPYIGTSKVQKMLAKAYDVLYDALEGQDFRVMRKVVLETASIMIENSELYKIGVSYVDADGKKVDSNDEKAMKQEGVRPVLDSQTSNALDTIMQIAFNHALEVVFKSENAMYGFIKKLRTKVPAAGFLLDVLMPFPRVQTNIFNQIIKFSPLGFVDVAKRMLVRKPGTDVKRDKDGNIVYDKQGREKIAVLSRIFGEARAKEIWDSSESNLEIAGSDFFSKLGNDTAKAIIGSTIMALGILLGALGIIRIDPEKDYNGYLLTIEIGGETYRIDISSTLPTAFSYPLLLGASVLNGDGKPNISSFVNQFLNLTFLGNILGTMRTYNVEDILPDLIEDYLVSYSPSIIRSIFKIIVPKEWQYARGGFNASWFGRILQRAFPYAVWGVDKVFGTDLLPVKSDPYTGEDKRIYDNDIWGWIFRFWNFISPMPVHNYIESDVQKLVNQYGITMSTSYNLKLSFDGKEGKLTLAQRNAYNRERGRAFSYLVKKTMTTSAWKKATNEEKKKMLAGLQTYSSTFAKASMWLNNNSRNYYNYTSDANVNKLMAQYLKNPRFRKVGKLREKGVNYYGNWL